MKRPSRILCVTPNVSLDRTLVVPGFAVGEVWRATDVLVGCGGKGVNVARAAQLLGAETVCAGFLAGHAGRAAAEMAEREGLECRWTWIDGETRTNMIVVEPNGGEATVINAPGPVITEANWDKLTEDVLYESQHADCVCVCGSLPPGAAPEGLAHMVRQLRNRGLPVWVDNSGAALASAVRGVPTGVKVNAEEIGELLGRPIRTAREAAGAAVEVRREGIGAVVVTLGRAGAISVTEEGIWRVRPPVIHTTSAVGSGDSFMAGLVSGLLDGLSLSDTLRRATAAGSATAMRRNRSFRSGDFDGILAAVEVEPATI
ncbi:MAG: 1-phosphofructokinase family hexose kinase [Alphaproteobacteria bacterium]|nr:1-phosphofructokinase family hexose kinase [Alphaproteobacteria bacterium]